MFTTTTLRIHHSVLALLLLTVISTGLPSTEARATAADMACDKELMECLKQHLVRFNNQPKPEETCSIIEDFSNCVSAIECLDTAAKNQLITNVTASFKSLNVDCDQMREGTLPDIPSEGSAPEDSGEDQACTEAKANCTTKFVEESFSNEVKSNGSETEAWFCPGINRYLDCLKKSPCDIEDYGQKIPEEIEQLMNQAGIECDIDGFGDADWDGEDDGEDEEDDMEGDSTDEMAENDGDDDVDMSVEDMGDGSDGKDDEDEDGGDEQDGEDGEEEEEEEGEQAGATLKDTRDAAPSSISTISCLTVSVSLAASLAILYRH